MSNETDRRHGADVILITKQLRMDWVDAMATDPNLEPATFKVLVAISTHFGNKSGLTYVSQKLLAKVTGLSLATVGRALMDGERRGYIIIRRRQIGERADGRKVYGGKGVANEYLPAVNAAQISATDRGRWLVERVQRHWEESQKRAEPKHITGEVLCEPKHIAGDVLKDQLSTSNTSPKHITGDVPTLNLPSEGNSSRARDVAERLGPPGLLLRKRLGEEVFESWFGKLGLIQSSEPSVVTLVAPTRFIRDRVIRDYLETALACWRANDPAIERIDVVLGPTPTTGERS